MHFARGKPYTSLPCVCTGPPKGWERKVREPRASPCSEQAGGDAAGGHRDGECEGQ